MNKMYTRKGGSIVNTTLFLVSSTLNRLNLKSIGRQLMVVALFLMCGLMQKSWGQAASSYTYSTTTGNSLVTITSPTSTTTTVGGTYDDDYTVITPSGFSFSFAGTAYTTYSMSTNGWMAFGTNTNASGIPTSLTSEGTGNPGVYGFGRDANLNNVTYGGNFTTGPAAGGKYVFQWTNNSGGSAGATSSTYVTFQVVLWGSTSSSPNRIDIIYSANTGTPSSAGTIGIVDGTDTYINGISGSTTSTSTSSSYPTSGTQYTFVPPTPPTFSSLSASSGCGSTFNFVTTGTSLAGVTAASVGGVPVTTIGTNTTTSVTLTPAAGSSGVVSVTCTAGIVTSGATNYTDNRPSTQASTVYGSAILATTATVNFTRGNGSNVLLVAYPGASAGTAPVTSTTYTANAAYGSGTGLGTGFVVYNGTGSSTVSVNVTALTANTQYTFVAYEYNSTGPCYNQTTTASATFTTVTSASISTWVGGTSTVWALAGNWSPSGIPTASSNVVIPSGTTYAPTIGAAALCNTLTINSGATLTISASYGLTVGNATSGSITNNGTISGNATSTLTFSGATQTINGTGTTTFGAVSVPTGYTVTLNTSCTMASLSFSSVSATCTFNISGTNTLTVSGATTMARPSSSSYTCTINVNAGTFTTGTLTMSATTLGRNDVINVSSGTFTTGAVTSGGVGCEFIFTGGAGIMNFNATPTVFSTTPTLTTVAGSTVNYNGAGAQTVLATIYDNLTLSGSGAKTISSSSTVNNVLSLQGTATTTGSATTYGAAATLEYKGTSAQTTGTEFSTPFTSTGGVRINNALGVTLNAPSSIGASSILNLYSGNLITTATNVLTILNTSNTAITRTASNTVNFVSGPLIWTLPTISSATSYVYPLGKTTTYLPFTLTPSSATSGATIKAEAFLGTPSAADAVTLSSLSSTEYWTASVTSGTYTQGTVSLGRQSATTGLVIGVTTTGTATAGTYSSLGGTVSGNNINTSNNTGSSLGSFCMGTPITYTNYYSRTSGNLDALSTWTTDPTGATSVSPPSNFTTNYCYYNILNQSTPTLGAAWTVSGTGSKVILGSASASAISFTIPASYAYSGTLDIAAASSGSNTVTILSSTLPTFGSINSGSTVILDGTSNAQTIAASSFGNLTIQNGTHTITAGGNITIAAGSTLTVASTGVLDMSTYQVLSGGATATITINGILNTANTAGLSGSTSTTISSTNTTLNTLGAASTINYYSTSAQVVTGGLSYYALTITGNSVKSIGANTTTTGTCTINSTATLNMNNYTLTVGSLAGSGILENTVSGSKSLTIGSDNTSTNYTGTIITGTGQPNLIKTGTGTLTLSGTNTYTGTTTVNGGIIKAGNTAAFGNSSAVTLANTSGVAMDITGYNITIGSLATGGSTGGNVTLGSATLSIGGLNTSTSYAGVISGTGGGITKTGTGTLTFTGANTYTGVTTISGGILSVGTIGVGGVASGNIGSATNAASNLVISGGTLQYTGAGETTDRNITFGNGTSATGGTIDASGSGALILSGSITSANTAASTQTFTFTGTYTGANSFNGTIADGTGSAVTAVTKSAAGTWILAGSNSYSGLTTISTGTLKLGAAGSGSNSPLGNTTAGTSITSGAVLDLNGYTLATAEPLTINGTGISSGGALINSNATAATYSGLLTLGSASSILTTTGDIIITNSGTISGATFGLTLSGVGTSSSIASIIGTTSGTITKSGAGNWTLSGANTYTGKTTVSAGTLFISADNNLGTAPVSVTATSITLGGGILSASTGFTLNTNRGITLTASSTIDVASGQTLLYGGVITGSTFGISKTSTGILTLSGTNTYTGTTTVTGGTLNVTGSLASGSAVTVGASGTLAGTGTVSGTVAANGAISPAGSGTGGTLTTGNETWNNGGSYTCDITGVGSTNCDKLIMGTLQTPASGTFTLNVSASAISGSFSNTTSYSWIIGSYTISGSTVASTYIAIPTVTGITYTGGFSISFSSGSVLLNYSPPSNVAISSTTTSAGNFTQNTTNNVLYQLNLAVSNATATLTGMTATTAGTYANTDITNLKVWYSAATPFVAGSSTLLSTYTSIGTAGSKTFPSFVSQSIPVGTGYIYITADIPCAANTANNIHISDLTTSNLTFSSSTLSGTTTPGDGGAQGFTSATPSNVGSVTPTAGAGSVSVAWATPAGCYSDVLVVASPATNTGGTPSGGAYSGASLTYGSGTAFGNGFIVYEGSTSPAVVTGLTNGTTYYFKVFTRNGTLWTSGVENSATPVVTYCAAPSYSTGSGAGDFFTDLHTTGGSANITNGSQTAIASPYYTNFGTTKGTLTVYPGSTFTLFATPSTYSENIAVWVDANNDGTFNSTTEYLGTFSVSASTQGSKVFTIPTTATIGNLRMRVALQYSTAFTGTEACAGSLTDGESEDYTILVLAPPSYYLLANTDPTVTTNWGTNTDGTTGSGHPSAMNIIATWNVTHNSNTPSTTWANTWTLASGATVVVDASTTFNVAGTLDMLGNQITAGASATINATSAGTIRTSNTAGFSGSTSTTISSTNSPTITLNGTSTVEYYGSSALTVTNGTTYGNLTFSGTSTATIAGNTTINGNLNLSGAAGTFRWNNTGSSYSVTVGGNLTMTNGALLNLNANSSNNAGVINYLNLSGNLNISGASTYINSGYYPTGVIVFKGTSPTYTNTATGTTTIWTNFTVGDGTNPTTLTLASSLKLNSANATYPSTLTITNNATLNASTYNYGESGTYGAFVINSGGTLATANTGGITGTGTSSSNGTVSTTSMTNTYSAGANYIFNGATTTPFPATFGNPANVTVNAAVTLNYPATMSGTLTLGAILTTTSTNILTLTNVANTAISGASSTQFINGPLTWTLGTASSGTYIVPVGVGTAYYPLAFTAGTIASGSPTINVTPNATGVGSADASTVFATSGNEYWKVVTTGTTFAATNFSLGRSTPALGNLTIIGENTSNITYASIGGSVSTLSGQPSVNTSTSGLSGASIIYLSLCQQLVTLSYNGNTSTSGGVPGSTNYGYNTTATVAANTGTLVKTGYTFSGWNTAADGSGTAYAASGSVTFTITSGTTLYAQWTPASIALSSPSQIGSANVQIGSTGSNITATNVLDNFQAAVTGSTAILNSVTFTTGGTYTANTDVVNYKLYYNSSNSLGGASQIGSTVSTGVTSGSTVSFTGLTSTTIANGSTGYFWLIADIAGSATVGNTINIAATPSVTFSYGGTVSGNTISLTGDQTFSVTSPTLSASSGQTVDNNFVITYTDDPIWDAAVTNIIVDGITYTNGGTTYYTITTGTITLTTANITQLHTVGSHTITAVASGYGNTAVTQSINAGIAVAAQSVLTPTSASITVAGTQTLTVTAKDQYSNNVGAGGSTVVFSNSTGTGTVGSATDNSNGTYTATVTAANLVGSGGFVATLNGSNVNSGGGSQTTSTITYTAGTATQLVYSAVPSTGTAGTAFSVTVQSQDAYGNVANVSSTTTITLSIATGGGTLSGTLTGSIVSGTNSVTIATPIYSKADVMTLTATASGGVSLTAVTSGSISFSSGAAYKIQLLLPGETAAPGTTTGKTGTPTAETAGTPFNVTVNVVDANWNLVSSATNTVTITSTDVNATMPSAAAVSAGTGTFSITLVTAGTKTVTATTTGLTTNSNTSPSVTINAGAFAKLQILLPGEVASAGSATGKTGATPTAQSKGTAFTVTVNAVDANWNIVTGAAADNIAITSSDVAAGLPSNNTLSSGVRTFSVTLNTAGTATVTATDATDGTKTANTSASVTVNDVTIASDYFKSVSSGAWATVGTWQSSHDNSTWITATLAPTSSATLVTVNNPVTITAITVGSVTIASAGTLTSSGNIGLNAGATISVAGILDMVTYKITAAGAGSTVSVTSTGKIRTSNTAGFSGSTSTTIVSTNTPTITLDPASTVEYYGTSTQTITNGLSYGNLTLSGSGTATLGGSTTLLGNYTQNAGTLIITPGSSAFTFTVGGTFTESAGTIDVTGPSATAGATVTVTGATSIFSIEMEANSSNTASTVLFQVNNNVTFTGTSTSTAPYAFEWMQGGTSGTVYPITFGITGNFTWSGTGYPYTTGSGTAKGFVFNGAGTPSSPQTLTYSGAASSYGQIYQVNNGTTVQLLTGIAIGADTDPYCSFTVNTGGKLDVQNYVISGGVTGSATSNTGFTLASGATLITSNGSGVGGSITDVVTNYNAAANYVFNAATTSPFPAAITTMNNLTLNANVSLGKAQTVAGTLTFTSGILTTTTANLLTLTNVANTAISGASSTSFINGPLTWTLGTASTGSYIVPVGVGTAYYPLAFTAGSIASGSPTINVTPNATGVGTADNSTVFATSGNEYWKVITTGTTFAATNFSLGRSTPALGNLTIIGKNTANSSYASIGGSVGTLSSQPSVNTSSSGLSGASTFYLAICQQLVTVSYNGNTNTGGAVPGSTNYGYNTTATVAANTGTLVKTGYTFSGWNTAADGSGTAYAATGSVTFTITSSTILYAQWTGNVTYSVNGGSGTAPTDATNYLPGALVTTASGSGLTKSGYTFASWNTAANGSGTTYAASTSAAFSFSGAITLYAKWTGNVTYSVNGGSGTAPTDATNYLSGASVTTASGSGLSYTGYTFAGWNTAADGSGTTYAASTGSAFTFSGAITLYAKWTGNVTYSVNGGSGTAPTDATNYLPGASVTTASGSGLTKSGYTFAGWNTASDGSGTTYAASTTGAFNFSGAITLYAKWTGNVTYSVNGGSGTAPTDATNYLPGASVTTASGTGLTKSGYTFAGWNTAANGSGTTYAASTSAAFSFSGAITLYAKWTGNVTYSVNGGSGTAPTDATNYLSGASVTTASGSGLSYTGYTFAGWNTASDGSGTTYAASTGSAFTFSGAITLYAKWTFNVTYNGNGNTGGTAPTDATNYTQAASVNTASNSGTLVKAGYTFAGWNTAADGSGTTYTAPQTGAFSNTGNITLYAKWTGIAGYWVGTSGTDYSTAANWANNAVPTASDNVIINSGTPNAPALSGTGYANSLTISGSATLTITGTLNIAGDVSNGGTIAASAGTIVFNGTGAQSVAGGFTVNNLTIDNSAGVSLGSSSYSYDTVFVKGIYTPTSGTLTTNGSLVLVSDASGTASVAAGTGTYISGDVTVERFHNNKRAWLMITAPLTTYGSSKTGDIYSNWQQDTYITGNTTAPNGLDAGTNTAYGIKYWTGTAWANGISSSSSVNTNSSNSLFGGTGGSTADNKAFSVFVRGDRSVLPSLGATGHSAVTLRASGSLQTGTLTQSIAGSYSFAANPYAAPIDLDLFKNDNTDLASSGGNYTFYYWDPNISGTGGYTTASYLNGLGWFYTSQNLANTTPEFVQSGQAFFVLNPNPSTVTSVTFNEGHKNTSNSSNGVFGNSAIGSIKVNLSKGSPLAMIDEVQGLYNNNFSAAVVSGEDAVKFWGNEENVSIIRGSSYLSMEARPMVATTDTMFLYMYNLVAGTSTYNFAISGSNMPANATGYLVDNYLGTQTPLNLSSVTNINFAVTTVAGSKASNRFMIVFTNTNPLSVDGMQIKASVKAKAAIVDWKVVTEKNVDHYEVERSNEGVSFVSIATQAANNVNNSSYTYTDNQAANGANYYRIKAISKDGTVQYSSVAKVLIGDSKEGISVYPNPIVGKNVNIILNNIEAGNYAVAMYNSAGKEVMVQNLAHAGGSVTTTVELPANLSTGVYQLRLAGNGRNYVETVIVK